MDPPIKYLRKLSTQLLDLGNHASNLIFFLYDIGVDHFGIWYDEYPSMRSLFHESIEYITKVINAELICLSSEKKINRS